MELLTPNEARKLDKMLRFCEKNMQDDYLMQKTNILAIYNRVISTINFHTDAFLAASVYSVEGVSKPVEHA